MKRAGTEQVMSGKAAKGLKFAVDKVAEGELVLRFKSTAKGVKISKDILRFSK